MGGHQFYPTNTSAAKNRIPDTGYRKPDFPESRFSGFTAMDGVFSKSQIL